MATDQMIPPPDGFVIDPAHALPPGFVMDGGDNTPAIKTRAPSWYDKAAALFSGQPAQPTTEKPGVIQDIVQSAPGAFARASAGLAGLADAAYNMNKGPEHAPSEAPGLAGKFMDFLSPPNRKDSTLGAQSISGLKQLLGSAYQDPQTTPGKIADFAAQNMLFGAKKPADLLNAPQTIKNLIQGTVSGGAGELVPDDSPKLRALVQAATGATMAAGPTAVKNLIRGTEKEAGTAAAQVAKNAQDAHEAGYVTPPNQSADSMISDALGGWSGKKIEQKASIKNQENTNSLVKSEFGLPKDAVLDEKTFSDIRKDASGAYKAVKAVTAPMKTDTPFRDRIANIGGANSQAAREFPDLMANPEIDKLRESLMKQKPFTTTGAIDVVKQLRGDATKNLKTIGDPSKHALGLAQRDAANAVDDLVERNLGNMGYEDLVKEYRTARQTIAKSHDMESVTNTTTGNVSARGAARLMDKGKPLTGNLKKVAQFGASFPKSAQSPDVLGSVTDASALDFGLALGSVAHGNPGMAGAILGRPLARNALLSKPYQDAVFSPKQSAPVGPVPLSALINSTMPQSQEE